MTVNWRTVLLAGCTLALGVAVCDAQPRRRPPSTTYAPIGLPDQAEGQRILEASRQIGFGDSYYLEFELRLLPRVGPDVRLSGRWFGANNVSGPITRLEILHKDGTPEIWLVQGGEHPQVWRRGADGRAEEVAGSSAAIAGSQISAVDLQTPFMQWTEFTYEGMLRFRGRPTHVFLLYPPDSQAARYPGVGGVRAFIDTEFNALSQVQWVDEDGKALKTITAGSVRKVPGTDRWIVTTLDVRDETTRNKSRIIIGAAALDLPLPGSLFLPAGELQRAEVVPPEGSLRRFE
ncbi:MAG: outer membrane lipoprotein-sorting protein [Opitutaceae bacterium]|nr:outer membrane lipoprotein-sorting protein [Opitutaceae bacterium]